jgi:hypothetical protein
LAYEWWYYILFPLVLAALWPIVNSGWRRTEEKAETLKKLKAEKVQPRIAQMGTDEEARGTEQGERGTAKSGNAQKLKHEIGKIIDSKIIGTTKDTNQHEKEEAGARLTSQSGAAFSNPFTSELLRNSENTSFTRSASGPAGALRSGEMGSGGGNQLGDSVEFLDGQSQAGLQMDSQKRHSPRAATGSDTSGEISLSVPIRDIRGSKSEALDAGLSTLDLSPRQRFMIGAGSFLAVAGLCWFLTWHILILFGVWLLGVVSAVFGPKLFSFQPSVFKWTFLLISTGISFGSLLVARVEFLKWGALDQFLIGIGFSLLLAALAPMAWRFPLQGWAHYFSDFSYSVYLIHFPVIMFALSMGFDLFGNGTRMPFGLLALGWYACIFSLAIFMSWLVSQFTERKTATLRKWLYGLLSVRES